MPNSNKSLFLSFDSFGEIKLDEKELSKGAFKGIDTRYKDSFPKFLELNKDALRFLGLTSVGIQVESSTQTLTLQSSRFIGCVPLRNPATGLITADIILLSNGEENQDLSLENIQKLITFVGGHEDIVELHPTWSIKTRLILTTFNSKVLIDFLKAYFNYLKNPSTTFLSEHVVIEEFKGAINWEKYSTNLLKQEANKIPTRVTKRSSLSDTYKEINYVFELVKNQMVPQIKDPLARNQIRNLITVVKFNIQDCTPKRVHHFQINYKDSITTKAIKEAANKVLQRNNSSMAWRLDLAKLFELFVSQIFRTVLSSYGAATQFNPKFQKGKIEGNISYKWVQNHLEPDFVGVLNEHVIIVDAKFKNHLSYGHKPNEVHKETHRADLHQILAYASFFKKKKVIPILCYPSKKFEFFQIPYTTPYSFGGIENKVTIIGMPFSHSEINSNKEKVRESLEKQFLQPHL